jgi:hypothetical protein
MQPPRSTLAIVTAARGRRVRAERCCAALVTILALGLCAACQPASSTPPVPSHTTDAGRGSGNGEPNAPSTTADPVSSDAPLTTTVDGAQPSGRGQTASTDSRVPVRAAGGEDTVVVSASGPQPAVPSEPPAQPSAPTSVTIAAAPSRPLTEAPPPAPTAPEPPAPAPAKPTYNGPVSGKLTCHGSPVIQNGEVVFGGLPPGRLQITYDTEGWDMRIRPDENNTQKVVLRNKRPGVQRNCTVTWQLVE